MSTAKTKDEMLGVGMGKEELRRTMGRWLLEAKEHFLQLHSGRGPGKSYTTQKTIIDYCLTNCREFCLTVPTIKLKDSGILKRWTAKCLANEFRGYQVKCTSDYLFLRKSEDEDWQLIGRCIALSNADNDAKNDSSVFRVDWLIWDESARMKIDIAATELLIDLFLSAYHTIDRDENRVKAVFIGNALNKLDPVYTFFNVTPAELRKPGIVKRSFNKASWYVPIPPDLEDENTTFRQMIKGTRYGEISAGVFNISYGDLLGDPGENEIRTCYSIQFTEDSYLLIMPCNGIIYIEACDKAFADMYATSKYTSLLKEATPKQPFVPYGLINYIKQALAVGKCKFVDEESLLTGSARLKMCFNIQIL